METVAVMRGSIRSLCHLVNRLVIPGRIPASRFLVLLWLFVICNRLCSAAATNAQSEWVHLNYRGELAYKTLPTGDRIMDFSSAGYMGGGVSLPKAPVRVTVGPSGGDDT